MSGEQLRALAAQVEAYDPRLSPDNRADEMPLDLAIAKVVGVAEADWQVARGSVTGYFSGDGVGGFGNPTVLPYTRSLDAAATLVPAGWDWTLYTGADRRCEAGCAPEDVEDGCRTADTDQALAATPALALIAATLRSRASLADTPTQVNEGDR